METISKEPLQDESQFTITHILGVTMLHHPNGYNYVDISSIGNVLEVFKQEVVKQNKSATIIEQDDGSTLMTIHGG
jgi:hypothetical protein